MVKLNVGKLQMGDEVVLENVGIELDIGPYLHGIAEVIKASPEGIGKFFDAIGSEAAEDFKELRDVVVPLLIAAFVFSDQKAMENLEVFFQCKIADAMSQFED